MMIPQAVTGIEVSITYTVTAAGEPDPLFSGTKTATLSGTWEPGSKISYDLTLASGAKKITLTPSVGGWQEPTPTPTPFN